MLDDFLRRMGVAANTVDRIRLGPDVVGRTTWVALAALVVLGIVAYKGAYIEWILAGTGAAVVLLFIVYFIGVLWFAHFNPEAALLEGAELLQWKQIELAAKGVPAPSSGGQILDPSARDALPPPRG